MRGGETAARAHAQDDEWNQQERDEEDDRRLATHAHGANPAERIVTPGEGASRGG